MSTKNVVVILLILVVLLSGIGIFLGINMYKNNKSEEKPIETFSLTLEDMYCDLKDSNSIAKINVTVETYNERSLETLENKIYLVRNNINEIVRNKTEEELKGKNGQVNLQKEIKDSLVNVFNDEAIINVYFNQFVIQ